MKKIIGFLVFIILHIPVVAQQDYLGVKVGLVKVDLIGDATGVNFEINYERTFGERVLSGIAVGIANQDNFPDFLSPKQQLFSGVPQEADEIIRSLTLYQGIYFGFDQVNTDYFQFYIAYKILRFRGFELLFQPGLNLMSQQISSFGLDEFQVMNGTIDSYQIAYRTETFLSAGWSAEFGLAKKISNRTKLLIHYRFTQHVRIEDFKNDYELFGLGLKRQVFW